MKRLLLMLAALLLFLADANAKEITLPDYPSQSTVPYHFVTLKRGETLQKLFGNDWEIVSRFNRIHPSKIRSGLQLKVPDDLATARTWTPMPLVYEKAFGSRKYILVNLNEQFLGAYEYGALSFSLPISSANPECLDEKFRKKTCYTVQGEFRVLAFHKDHVSSIYTDAESGENVPMPYAVLFAIEEFRGKRLAYWMHQGELPGTPDSHGCVRLMPEDAKRLFLWLGGNPTKEDVTWVKNGAPVEVTGQPFTYARQGEIVLEELPQTPDRFSKAFLTKAENGSIIRARNLTIFEKDGKNYALIPLAVDETPGQYQILAMGESITYRKTLLVDRGKFPVNKSSSWNSRPFTKDELARIAKEKEEMAKAYENAAATPLWLDSSAGFSAPIASDGKKGVVTHPFGEIRLNPNNKKKRYHFGADIRAPEGEPVFAVANGKVVHVGHDYFLEGNITIIDHGAGVFSLYLHQSKILVTKGQLVKQGDVIGEVGETGNANGPHLHLAVKINGIMTDPMKLIELLK
ncbi:MAG: peptidoglycan DD-metalloendopeptidase family protein [Patescibacteria group bacterium]